MKIALNGERLTIEKFAGPELYTLNIIKALLKIDEQNEYTLLLKDDPTEKLNRTLADTGTRLNYVVLKKKNLSWTHMDMAKWLYLNMPDILFTAVHTLPVLRPLNMKSVAMIHGLEHKYNSEEYKNKLAMPGTMMEKLVCAFAEKIVVPSEYTKQAIQNTGWKLKNPEIEIIPEGVSSQYRRENGTNNANTLTKYNLSNKMYAVFVSTIQPRKNLPKLVEAISILNRKDYDIELVVVGKKGWEYEESLKAPEKHGIQDKVHFLGRLPTNEVVDLLVGAKMFVSPSLEEGFGLPVLEAMACETPLVISDIPPYKDLAETTAYFFDPNSAESIANTLESFLNADLLEVSEKVTEAKTKANEYTWERAAKKLLEVFEKIRSQ